MSRGRGRCVICRSMFVSHNVAALYCGHTFHFECVSKWLEGWKTCPICRVRTSESQIIPHLYFDTADELDATQLQSSDAAQVETLSIALEKQKNISLEAQEEVLNLKNSLARLQAELDRMKKLLRFSLIVLNRRLNMMSLARRELEKAHEELKIRLRAYESSSPQIPISMRGSTLKCSENTPSTGLGGAELPAVGTLANLKLRYCLSDEASKMYSLLKRNNNANDANKQGPSQSFPK